MIRFNLKIEVQDRFIKLFTNSQAAIQALISHEVKSIAVQDSINALNQVGQKVN